MGPPGLVSLGVVCMVGESTSDPHDICFACALIQTAVVGLSYMALLLLAVDRYLAVSHALRYKSLMNVRRAVVLVAVFTVFSLAWGWTWIILYARDTKITECTGSMAVLPPIVNMSAMFGVLLLICAVNTVLYGSICCIARKQRKKINRQRGSSYMRSSLSASNVINAENEGDDFQTVTIETATNDQNADTKHSDTFSPNQLESDTSHSQHNVEASLTLAPSKLNESSIKTENQLKTLSVLEPELKNSSISLIRNPNSENAEATSSAAGASNNIIRKIRTVSFASSLQPKILQNPEKRQSIKQDLRLVKSMFLVMTSNLLLGLPYFIISLLTSVDSEDKWERNIRKFSTLLVMCNSAVNPVIHTWANRRYREAVLKLFKKNKVFSNY